MPRSVLYIDPAYPLHEVREKKHESFFLARHASGFFPRVWSVHPVADLVGARKGGIDVARFARGHAVIEGKVESLRLPAFLVPLNFMLSQLKLFLVLRRVIRHNNVSLVMAADPFWSGVLGLALSRACRKPLGIRIGGNYDDLYEATGALAMPRLIPSYRLQKLIGRFVLKRADLVAGINRNNLGFGVANGARRHTAVIPISSNIAPIHQVPPEERPSAEDALRLLGISPTGPVLLYVGRLLELKHPDDALRAMAAVIHRHPATSGILAGAGPMLPRLRELAASLGVAHAIHFVGQLDQETLSRIIPRCITVSPHTGLSLIECALGGSPVVAYDRDWQPEFIEDGVNGFIVPFRDWHAMAHRLTEIVENPDLAERFSTAIRARGLRHVDPASVRQLEWTAFSAVLGETA